MPCRYRVTVTHPTGESDQFSAPDPGALALLVADVFVVGDEPRRRAMVGAIVCEADWLRRWNYGADYIGGAILVGLPGVVFLEMGRF